MTEEQRLKRNRASREYQRKKRAEDPVYRKRYNAATTEYRKRRAAADPLYKQRLADKLRRWKTENAAHCHAQTLRIKAKRRGLEWSLPEMLALDLVTDNCFYCGANPDPTNGIDRVDNARGYVEDNVVTSCRPCNVAKLDRPLAGFLAWVERAHAHQVRYFGGFERNPI